MRTDFGRTIWAFICAHDRISVETTGGSASIRRWWPWILAVKPFKNSLDLGCWCSYANHLFLMSTMCAQLSPWSFHCHQWINSGHFRFLIEKSCTPVVSENNALVFGRRFTSWLCIYLLCIIFSHYVLINCSIYILYVIRSCCEGYLSAFYMSHFLPLFMKLLTFLVGFELTTEGWFTSNWLQHFTTVLRKASDMYCYLYIYI